MPQILKSKPQFCCWKYEERSGRKTKVPYNPVTGKRAKPNQHGTFKDFSSAVAAISDYDGIGFLVGNDICVIDLDDCFDSSGKLKPVAQNVVEAFSGCYMEHSPSEKGLHIFFKATSFNFDKTKYYINNRKLGVEVYVAGATNRFVTVTGNVFADGDIAEKSNELQMILDKYMLRPTPVKQLLDTESQSYLSDKSVIEKGLKSANGEKFKALWQGDTSGYASASEADLALCGMLAFWCGRDIGQIDRLFRQSGLMRDKWNRSQSGSTYGMITIEKAIANVTKIYKPGGKRSSVTEDFSECSLTDFKPESNDRYPWTDIGASRLFADYYKSFARYVPERKMWFCYENGIWIPDIGNLKVMEMCKSLANQLLTYALTIQDEHQRKAYIDYCRKWQSRRYRETVLKDAQSVYPISMAEFDQDPQVLNCANGTLFLTSMDFHPHNSEDRLTKISGVKYDPEAKSERWDRFIHEIMSGDEEKAKFLQKAFGYSISGDTRYECLFVLYGATKNLKREFAKPKNQSAILNWLIEGYQLLKKEGLTLPDSVKTATEAYKRDSDKIALFFEDALEESPNSEVRTSEVYARYQRWCSANGCYSENARNFKQALTAIARVERKRPRSGGGMTTMLIGYKLTEEEFLLI